jgi:uncharacterized protein
MTRFQLLLGCLALSACAPEAAKQRVSDGANILDAATEEALSARLARAERNYGPQLVVVTINSLKGQPIEEYSLELAKATGIGDKVRNDGLLLVVAPNERKTRIEVGTGLEASFTNAYAQSVVDEVLLPKFKAGRFQDGIEAAVNRLIAKMKEAPTNAANDNDRPAKQKDAA